MRDEMERRRRNRKRCGGEGECEAHKKKGWSIRRTT